MTVRIVPADDIEDTPDMALYSTHQAGGVLPGVIDMRISVEGLSRNQALMDMTFIRTASRNNKFSVEISKTAGLSAASVGEAWQEW